MKMYVKVHFLTSPFFFFFFKSEHNLREVLHFPGKRQLLHDYVFFIPKADKRIVLLFLSHLPRSYGIEINS